MYIWHSVYRRGSTAQGAAAANTITLQAEQAVTPEPVSVPYTLQMGRREARRNTRPSDRQTRTGDGVEAGTERLAGLPGHAWPAACRRAGGGDNWKVMGTGPSGCRASSFVRGIGERPRARSPEEQNSQRVVPASVPARPAVTSHCLWEGERD